MRRDYSDARHGLQRIVEFIDVELRRHVDLFSDGCDARRFCYAAGAFPSRTDPLGLEVP